MIVINVIKGKNTLSAKNFAYFGLLFVSLKYPTVYPHLGQTVPNCSLISL